jgi:predicted MFS family arabinose efflux permease
MGRAARRLRDQRRRDGDGGRTNLDLIISYDFWRGAEEPAEPAWRRVSRIASTPPLRDYIFARVLEMTSKWMFRVTTALVVWQLTYDEWMLGLSLVCLLLPGLVMELVGGFFADRYDRRTVMVLSCAGSLACNLVIAALELTGLLSVGVLLSLVAIYGGINSLASASSKTIVTAFVRKEDLATAVSLNAVVFNVAGFIGPAVAAGIIYWLGPAVSYFTCAALSCGFILLFMRIPPPPREGAVSHGGFIHALQQGLSHVLAVRLLMYLFIMHIGAIALARPFVDFVPAIVHHSFDGGSRETGILLSAFGLGSIAGGLWLAGCEARIQRLATVALGAMPAFAVALVGVVLSPTLFLAAVFSFAAGFGMITRGGAIQSMLQIETHPSYRGRVMALHGVSFELGCIVGAIFIGQVAKATTITLALMSCVCLLLALWSWIRVPLREAAAESGQTPSAEAPDTSAGAPLSGTALSVGEQRPHAVG